MMDECASSQLPLRPLLGGFTRVNLFQLEGVLFRHFFLGHCPLPEREIDRIGIRIEDDEIEVPDNNCEGGQPCFIKMDGPGNVPPAAV